MSMFTWRALSQNLSVLVLLTLVYKRDMVHSQVLTLLSYGLVRSTNKLYSTARNQRIIQEVGRSRKALIRV